jgi:hypothetical protein
MLVKLTNFIMLYALLQVDNNVILHRRFKAPGFKLFKMLKAPGFTEGSPQA